MARTARRLYPTRRVWLVCRLELFRLDLLLFLSAGDQSALAGGIGSGLFSADSEAHQPLPGDAAVVFPEIYPAG